MRSWTVPRKQKEKKMGGALGLFSQLNYALSLASLVSVKTDTNGKSRPGMTELTNKVEHTPKSKGAENHISAQTSHTNHHKA